MGAEWFVPALAFAASMSGTPGPNNAMVAASGATFGFNRTVPHMLGVSFGFPFMLAAIGLGAGDLLRTVPALHTALKWVGAAYLLWLAYRIATADPTPKQAEARGRPLTFLQAALFQWVNPKAWIIAIGAVATYTTPSSGSVLTQTLALALIFLLVTLVGMAFWTMTGVGAAHLLRTPSGLRAFNWAMAALLVASLIPVVME